jgi:hypothetical protein
MALLSGMMRTAEMTGSTDSVFARVAGRQGRRWAEQTVRAAVPQARAARPAAPARPQRDPSATLEELTKLRERDIITAGELQRLRAQLHV